jgi:hypothetical protein
MVALPFDHIIPQLHFYSCFILNVFPPHVFVYRLLLLGGRSKSTVFVYSDLYYYQHVAFVLGCFYVSETFWLSGKTQKFLFDVFLLGCIQRGGFIKSPSVCIVRFCLLSGVGCLLLFFFFFFFLCSVLEIPFSFMIPFWNFLFSPLLMKNFLCRIPYVRFFDTKLLLMPL